MFLTAFETIMSRFICTSEVVCQGHGEEQSTCAVRKTNTADRENLMMRFHSQDKREMSKSDAEDTKYSFHPSNIISYRSTKVHQTLINY